jgi:hypothetical protein
MSSRGRPPKPRATEPGNAFDPIQPKRRPGRPRGSGGARNVRLPSSTASEACERLFSFRNPSSTIASSSPPPTSSVGATILGLDQPQGVTLDDSLVTTGKPKLQVQDQTGELALDLSTANSLPARPPTTSTVLQALPHTFRVPPSSPARSDSSMRDTTPLVEQDTSSAILVSITRLYAYITNFY